MPHPLAPSLHPTAVTLTLPALAGAAIAAEEELRAQARTDPNRCCGYFPSLAESAGILSDLPACAAFAHLLPVVAHHGLSYRFSFLRLSLTQQSSDAAYHLDSDADTAITGDVASLRSRRVLRVLLNLSTSRERALHYLDVDAWSVPLAVDGSYVRVADRVAARGHARVAAIPPRRGATVFGLAFASNLVLHSGVDDPSGHFVAAYGTEAASAPGPTVRSTQRRSKAETTSSRAATWRATFSSRSPNTH